MFNAFDYLKSQYQMGVEDLEDGGKA